MKLLGKYQQLHLTEILLLALLALLPFERIPSASVFGVSLRLPLVVAFLLIAAAVFRFRKLLLPQTITEKLFLAFLATGSLSALAALHMERSFQVLLFDLFVYALAIAVWRTMQVEQLPALRRWLLAGAVVVSIFALYQFIGDLLRLPITLTGLREDYTKAIFGFPRVQAASLEPLFFANYLLLPFTVALATLKSWWRLVLLTLFSLCFFLTVSRGGIGALVLVTSIYVLVQLWRRHFAAAVNVTVAVALGLGLAYGAISGLVPYLSRPAKVGDPKPATSQVVAATYQRQATNYEINDNRSERSKTRQMALDLFREHWLIGIGPGNFGYYANGVDSRTYGIHQTVNNLPYETLAETGVLGFGALLLFALSLFKDALFALWRQGKDSLWVGALILFLAGSAIQYWTFSTLYIIHIWIGVGLLLGLINEARKQTP